MCPASLHIALSKELEAASRSSKTYLAKDGGERLAPIQSWSLIRASESTKQNNLADTHRNSNVTDKLLRLIYYTLSVSVGGRSSLSVCLQHNSKTNNPKVFKLGTRNDLEISNK